MSTKQKILLASCCTLFAGILTYLLLPPRIPLSPIGSPKLTSEGDPVTQKSTYLILGFLPYWNLKKLTPDALSSTTHLAYFTLHLGDTGELVKLDRPGEEEPGYTNYKRALDNNYPNLVLTFMPYDQDALTSTLTNKTYRQNTVNTITKLIQDSGAIGINIDYEPLGSIPPSLRDSFTLFIKELSSELSNVNGQNSTVTTQLSISVYPSAASRPRIWDLTDLSEYIDYLVVMTYDYTLPGDLKTGPNSPLRGAGELFEHDILKNLAEITKLVPSDKILLGIPFYGYEWEADNTDKYTPTTSRGAVASLERIDKLIQENTLELLWDRNSLTPYAIRREEGEVVSQIYYESIDSIKLKLDLVKQANLGGIAIWALGYEGNNPQLWSTIRSLNTP